MYSCFYSIFFFLVIFALSYFYNFWRRDNSATLQLYKLTICDVNYLPSYLLLPLRSGKIAEAFLYISSSYM